MKNKKIKISRPKQIKHNAKITEMFCCSCNTDAEVLRNDAKFCGTTCRGHEFCFRKNIGYTKLLFNGTHKELQDFYLKFDRQLQKNPLVKDISEINNSIKSYDMTKSFKTEFDGYVVYYFSNRKKAPFEIYANSIRIEKGKNFIMKCKPVVKTKFNM